MFSWYITSATYLEKIVSTKPFYFENQITLSTFIRVYSPFFCDVFSKARKRRIALHASVSYMAIEKCANQMIQAGQCTVVQNNQESRLQYWVTRSSVCLFAHPFARLLAPLTRSPATSYSLCLRDLLRSLVPLHRSLRSLLRSWDSEWFNGYLFCVSFFFGP